MCPSYAVGPGHHTHSRNAVVEAYAETDALEVLCPNCGAKPGDFCVHENGAQRKIPCPRRISGRATKAQEER